MANAFEFLQTISDPSFASSLFCSRTVHVQQVFELGRGGGGWGWGLKKNACTKFARGEFLFTFSKVMENAFTTLKFFFHIFIDVAIGSIKIRHH